MQNTPTAPHMPRLNATNASSRSTAPRPRHRRRRPISPSPQPPDRRFLGVTLFFTLSGYLATKSIMRVTARDGFSYPRYICRRIARIMPPIVVTIALTAVATYIAAPSLLPKVQQDALPSALFLSNWFYIFRNVSYFAAAGLPSPLTHLWFCAVTMQFYLVWPVILMALCSKTRSRNTAIGITTAFALVSTAAMVLMFNPTADTSRVYYGTDTRCRRASMRSLSRHRRAASARDAER